MLTTNLPCTSTQEGHTFSNRGGTTAQEHRPLTHSASKGGLAETRQARRITSLYQRLVLLPDRIGLFEPRGGLSGPEPTVDHLFGAAHPPACLFLSGRDFAGDAM